jgi:hypothetical protein
LNDDFLDLLAALVRFEVRFLVVGAHAMAVHGVPRATGDLDIWVERSPENAHNVWLALAEFGAPLASLGISEADFTKSELVTQIGLPPSRIDVLTDVSGVVFSDAWEARVELSVGAIRVPFLGRAALIQNKRAAGRKKDLADLDALNEAP